MGGKVVQTESLCRQRHGGESEQRAGIVQGMEGWGREWRGGLGDEPGVGRI